MYSYILNLIVRGAIGQNLVATQLVGTMFSYIRQDDMNIEQLSASGKILHIKIKFHCTLSTGARLGIGNRFTLFRGSLILGL